MSETRQINQALNVVKGLACIFVVLMHCEFPGNFGIFIQCISRFCVPFFFAVSGYYCFYKDPGKLKVKMPGKISHIFSITLMASLLYIVWTLIKTSVTGNWGSLICQFTFNNILKFLFLNEPFIIVGHLWFLFALLYSYILFFIFNLGRLQKIGYVLMFSLLLLHFVVAYGAHLLGTKIPNCLYRNFLLEGFPLMLLGYYIHAWENKLEKVENKSIVTILFGGVLLSLMERYILGRDFGMHIGALLVLMALFMYAVKYKHSTRFRLLWT